MPQLSQPTMAYETVIPNPKLKLLAQMREVMRLRHYSIRTERAYCDWVRRYVRFHRLTSRGRVGPTIDNSAPHSAPCPPG